MHVKAFTNEAEPLQAFLRLPERVYAGDPGWIAPLRAEVARQVDPDRPVTEGHRVHNVLVTRGGEPVARASAIVNPDLSHDGEAVGQVGFFEALEDYEAAAAALDACVAWLREQGLHRVWGPMNFSIWHSYRLMTRGFETDAFLGEPRNPAYYPEFFTRYGFAPQARWFSWDLALPHLQGMYMASEALKGSQFEEGYRYEPFRTGDDAAFAEDLRRAHEVLSDGFAENLGFTPLPFEEFVALFGGMRPFLIPDLSPFAADPAGNTIGFGYLYPDAGPALRELKGDAGRAAELPGLLEQQPPRRLVFHTMAVRKDDVGPSWSRPTSTGCWGTCSMPGG